MKIALICGKCGKVFTEDNDDVNLIVDFRLKHFSFICQNKNCKADNIFDFGEWAEQSKRSPLPKIRIM